MYATKAPGLRAGAFCFTLNTTYMNMKLTEKYIVYGLYAVLLTPLVFYQQLMHPLITVKAIFFQFIIQIIGAVYLSLCLAYPEYRPRFTPLSSAVLFFLAALGLSAVFGMNPARSFWSTPERLTGIFFLIHCVILFFILTGMRGYFSWFTYFLFSVCVSFLVGLFPLIQLIAPSIFFDAATDNLKGTLGNPIFLAAYLLFHVVIAGWIARIYYTRKSRLLGALFAGIAAFDAFALVLTQTRGALVALFVVGTIASLHIFTRRLFSARARYGLMALWILCALAGAGIFLTRQAPVWDAMPVISRFTAEHWGVAPRFIAWTASFKAFLDRPVFGWGWENFYYALNAHYDPVFLRQGIGETFFDKPHNILIEFLATTGVIGFVAYMVLIGMALWAARRHPWMLAVLGLYVVQNMFAFDTVTSYIMFFIVLAYLDREHPAPAFFPRYAAARSWYPVLCAACFAGALAVSYVTVYRVARASHLEWLSINYFMQQYTSEGLAYFDQALTAETPYAAYIKKDIAPFIGQLYKQNVALPDARALVRRSARELEMALAADPNHYGFYIGFADFIAQVGDLEPTLIPRGIALVARAEELSPRRQTTKYVLSKLLFVKGDAQGAFQALRAAVDLDPEIGEAHFYYALVLLETHRMADAAREIDRAAALGRFPKTASEARLIAGYFGDANDYARAELYFQQALLLDPKDRETKMKLGLVYYLHGKRDAARRLISEVMKTENLKQSPQYPALQPILKELGLE